MMSANPIDLLIDDSFVKINKNLQKLIQKADAPNPLEIYQAVQEPVFSAFKTWDQQAITAANADSTLDATRKNEYIEEQHRLLYKKIALITHPDRISSRQSRAPRQEYLDNMKVLAQRFNNPNNFYAQAHAALEANKDLPSLQTAFSGQNRQFQYNLRTILLAKLFGILYEYYRYPLWAQYLVYWLHCAFNVALVIAVLWLVGDLLLFVFGDFADLLYFSREVRVICIGNENYYEAVGACVSDTELADYYRKQLAESTESDLQQEPNERIFLLAAAKQGYLCCSAQDARNILIKEYAHRIWGWQHMKILALALWIGTTKPSTGVLSQLVVGARILAFIPFLLIDSLTQVLNILLVYLLLALLIPALILKIAFTLLLLSPLYLYDAWKAYFVSSPPPAVAVTTDTALAEQQPAESNSLTRLSQSLSLLVWHRSGSQLHSSSSLHAELPRLEWEGVAAPK